MFRSLVRTVYTYTPGARPTITLADGSKLITKITDTRKDVSDESQLPPLVHSPSGSQRIYLSPEETKQARQLRKEDPQMWTVGRLAKKFNCTKDAIMAYAPAPSEVHEAKKAEFNRYFDNLHWGKKTRIVNRIRRRFVW